MLQIRVKFPDRRTPERISKSNLRLATKAGSKLRSGALSFSGIVYGKTEVFCNVKEVKETPAEEAEAEPPEETQDDVEEAKETPVEEPEEAEPPEEAQDDVEEAKETPLEEPEEIPGKPVEEVQEAQETPAEEAQEAEETPAEEADETPAEETPNTYVILSSCFCAPLLMCKPMSSSFHAPLLMLFA